MGAILLAAALFLPLQGWAQLHGKFGETDDNGQPTTPFAHALQQTNHQHRQSRGCQDLGPTDTPKQKRQKAQACHTEYLENHTDPPTTLPNGKQIHSKTTLYYEDPSQRGLTQWPAPHFGGDRTPQPDIENNSGPPDSHDPNGVQFTANGAPGHEGITPLPDGCANAGKGQGLPGGVPLSDGTCDLTRNIAVAGNNAAKNANAPPGQTKRQGPAFDVDANGNCTTDPTHPNGGAISCGQERRRQSIDETLQITCKPGSFYDDASGMCLKPGHLTQNGAITAGLSDFSYGYRRDGKREPALDSDTDQPTTFNAMMGFTFAPPEISWGYSIEEDACIDLIFDDFCFTIFSASIGYDFELGAGVRLPVQLAFQAQRGSDGPNDSPQPVNYPFVALASKQYTIQPSLQPADFMQQDYIDFCNNNNMADGTIIADCNTFSFPEFLSSIANSVVSSVPVDGKELVLQTKIKAGAFVTILDVPVLNLGVNASADVPTLCTLWVLKENKAVGDLLGFFANLGTSGWDVLGTAKQQNLNCASFPTPFGSQGDVVNGAAHSQNILPLGPLLDPLQPNTFPVPKTFEMDADCVKAIEEGKTVTVRGKERPICTGLEIKSSGGALSAGIGLELEVTLGSGLITADWSAGGDAQGSGGTLQFIGPGHAPISNPTFHVALDNFDANSDSATINLKNFTLYLDQINLALNAKLEFGGALSIIPDLLSLNIYSISFSTGKYGIPIPQHNATGPITLSVPVVNYALSINGSPAANSDPKLVIDNKTLLIKPGTTGNFNITGSNLGTTTDQIGNFAALLPDGPSRPFNLPTGWTITPNATGLHGRVINDVQAHNPATSSITLGITPVRDPLTRPGTYPVVLSADSLGARQTNVALQAGGQLPLPDTDPRGQARVNAHDTIFVRVDKFFDPRIGINPTTSPAKPGAAPQTYVVTGQNFGNVSDTELLTTIFADFNVSSCTLTTMGQGPGCPFRAAITQIPADLWTTFVTLATQLGPLDPLGTAQSSFTIAPPPNWAGMQDTTYDFTITSTSSQDGSVPPAHNSVTAHKTVLATKQSMTRYIGLELNELMLQIVTANSAGQGTGGTLPIVKESLSLNSRALTSILGGNLGSASTTLASEIRTMQAFLRAVAGPGIPPSLVDDWTLRANAILADLALAQASNIGS